MEGRLRALVIALLTQIAGCHLHISIRPNSTDVEDDKEITIRCGLNLRQTKTDRVYSIMLKRRGMTVAVLLTGGFELPDRQYDVDGTLSTAHPGSPYLQVTFSNVTCYDRGDYSCRMAVRRSYRNLQLGPVSSPFKVTGKPSAVTLEVTPRKPVYKVGEVVTFTCSALKKSTNTDWSWTLPPPFTETRESCSYSQSDCLYRCSSSVSQTISLNDTKMKSRCGYENNFKSLELAVTTLSVWGTLPEADPSMIRRKQLSQESRRTTKPDISTSETEAFPTSVYYLESRPSDRQGTVKITDLIYGFVSVFFILFLGLFLYIFVPDRYKCSSNCHKRRNDSDDIEYIPRKRYMKRGEMMPYPHRDWVRPPTDRRHLPSAFEYPTANGRLQSESDYLIPQNDVEVMNQRNGLQSSQSSSGSENIYEDIGQACEHASNITYHSKYDNDVNEAHPDSTVIQHSYGRRQ